MYRSPLRTMRNAVTLFGFLGLASTAHAQLSLTPAGVTAGFTLTTYADGFPNSNNIGPLAVAFSAGTVLVTDYPGNVRVFPSDADGQHAGDIPVGQNYGTANAAGITSVGSTIYMTQQSNGRIVQLNANGTFNQAIVNITNVTGLITNPNNGHLFATGFDASGPGGFTDAIFDVDPIAKTFSVFTTAAATDGLSTDGTTLYVASNNSILGYNIASKALVFNSGFINTVDGTALGFGSLAGNIFANTNDGRVVEVNLSTLAQSVIASGGSRGDFVTVDPNGSLLLSQTDRLQRLSPAAGGGFTSTPEPGTVGLFVAFIAPGAGILLRRRRRSP
jgi:hypothetical protein